MRGGTGAHRQINKLTKSGHRLTEGLSLRMLSKHGVRFTLGHPVEDFPVQTMNPFSRPAVNSILLNSSDSLPSFFLMQFCGRRRRRCALVQTLASLLCNSFIAASVVIVGCAENRKLFLSRRASSSSSSTDFSPLFCFRH